MELFQLFSVGHTILMYLPFVRLFELAQGAPWWSYKVGDFLLVESVSERPYL